MSLRPGPLAIPRRFAESGSLEQLYVIAPAMILAGLFITGLLVFAGLCLIGRRPQAGERRTHSRFFFFFINYFVWLIGPVERVALALRFTPNQVTFLALAACASSGLAIGTGHMATAGWLYIVAGALDVLDGRMARATGRQSRAGAFLDSVTGRWGEMFVFTGFAWFLHESAWLLALMLAVAGSVMVSYTRARGEGLGVTLNKGNMQRPERIALVSIGTLITAWFDAASDTAEYGIHVIGVCLLIVGVGSTVTAVHRWLQGFRALRAEDEAEEAAETSVQKKPAEVPGKV